MNQLNQLNQTTEDNPNSGWPRRGFTAALVASWLFLACQLRGWADDRTLGRRGRHRVEPLCSLPPADYQHGARSPSVILRSQLAIPLTQAENVERAISAIEQLLSPTTLPPLTPLSPLNPMSAPAVATLPADEAARINWLREVIHRDQIQAAIQAATTPRAKLLLLPQRQMAMMHCEVSDVALLVEPTGLWHLSLRADQNPISRRGDQARNLELQMKRNAFRIQFRLLHSARVAGESLSTATLTPRATDQAGKPALAQVAIDEFWVEREAPYLLVRRGYDPLITHTFDLIDQVEFEFYIRLDPLTGNGRGVVLPWQREP